MTDSVSRSPGAHRAKRPGRAKSKTAILASTLTLVLALSTAACSTGLVQVGVQPSGGIPQVGAVESGSPAASPGAAAQTCNPQAISLLPTAAAATSAAVQAIRKRGQLVVGVAQDGYLTGYLDASATSPASTWTSPAGRAGDLRHPGRRAHPLRGRHEPRAHHRPARPEAGRRHGRRHLHDHLRPRQAGPVLSTVYYEATQRVLVLKNSGYKSLDDLGGKKVCAQSDSTSLQAVEL